MGMFGDLDERVGWGVADRAGRSSRGNEGRRNGRRSPERAAKQVLRELLDRTLPRRFVIWVGWRKQTRGADTDGDSFQVNRPRGGVPAV